MKTCTKCGQPGEFAKDRSKKDGLRPECKVCQKAWRKAYRERELERHKAWYQDNREHKLERNKAWWKANPDKRREHKCRRRARKAGAAGYHTTEQWQARLAYYGWKCYYCGCDGDMEEEHRIPLSRGGPNWPANLVPACKSCNSRKHNKTEFEFLRSRK